MAKLTVKGISGTMEAGLYGDGLGLYLSVSKAGTKSWSFRFTLNKKAREMGLGSLSDISLAEARDLASDCRKLLAAGVDPIEDRKAKLDAERSVPTFRVAAEKFIASIRDGFTNEKHAKTWNESLEKHVFPKIGELRVDQITAQHVLGVFKPIWIDRHETASRVLQRVERIMGWALALGYTKGQNVAAYKGFLENLLPKVSKTRNVQHQPSLPWQRVPEFMKALEAQNGMGAKALWFTIMTTCRSGEIRGLLWSEFDEEAGTITIAAERVKTRKPHVVPLSPELIEFLKAMPKIKGERHVFAGIKRGKPLSDASLLAVIKRMNKENPTPYIDENGESVVVHGFRGSFKTWATEATDFPREIVEQQLAHVVGNKVEAAYLRGTSIEKRRELVQAWVDYAAGSKRESGVVIDIQQHRRSK